MSTLTCLLFNHLLWARCASESNLHDSVAYDQEGSSRLIIFRDFLIALSIIASPPLWPSPYLLSSRRATSAATFVLLIPGGPTSTSAAPRNVSWRAANHDAAGTLKPCWQQPGAVAVVFVEVERLGDQVVQTCMILDRTKKNKHVVVTKIKASHGLSSRLLSKALFLNFATIVPFFFLLLQTMLLAHLVAHVLLPSFCFEVCY